jgi:putative ABC transport system permease protein
LVILFMSCFNYINLTTARFTARLKEIGIRKVVGAQRKQLVSQFMMEALIFTSIAFLLALLLIVILTSTIQNILGYDVTFKILDNQFLLLLIFLTGIAAAIICGSYPAIFFSKFRSSNSLKDSVNRKTQRHRLRNVFVIFQFSITIILLICTSLIYKQVQFMKLKDLGYSKNQIVIVPIKDDEVRQKSEVIKNELKRLPEITNVSFSSSLPSKIQRSTTMDLDVDGNRKVFEMSFSTIDYDFFELYKINLNKGRNFSRDFPTDLNGSIILNEQATEILNWENPIGRELDIFGGIKKVVGVVQDFNFQTLHSEIGPLALQISGDQCFFASINISLNNIPQTLENIKKTFDKFAPNGKSEQFFFDDYFGHLYSSEENFGRIIRYFTLLAIIISFSGLFGLTFFTTEQRTKEIGVRKIVGASVLKITFMLTKEFIKWSLLANIIAWPLAYLIMIKWFQNFAYQTKIEIGTFIFSGILALVFTLLCVSYRSIKTALINPADSLRYE